MQKERWGRTLIMGSPRFCGLEPYRHSLKAILRSTPAPLIAAMLLILLAVSPATTAPKDHEMFGHEVVVRRFVKHVGEAIIGTDVLTVDKKALLRDRQVYLEQSGSFGGTGFVVGSNSSGAMCDNSIFVLAFPPSGPARVDGPIETGCRAKYGVEKDNIIFETVVEPDNTSNLHSRWIWTTAGFGPAQHYKTKTGVIWNLLQDKAIRQPADLLEHAELKDQLDELFGFWDQSLFGVIKGPGSVRYEGPIVFGEACQAGDCGVGSLLVAVDRESKKVFIALKKADKPAVIKPERTAWPSSTQKELGRWMSQWAGK
jgi:hypothetical protein